MSKNNILGGINKANPPIKSKVINADARHNTKLQAYKKSVLDKAIQKITKIEEDIKNFENNLTLFIIL